jgi:hypothetical protein
LTNRFAQCLMLFVEHVTDHLWLPAGM